MVFELIVALALIALNGAFALSELAIVSARKSRLKTMADNRRVGAKAALALAEEPGRFLSTVQIGITLIGVLAGAFSGAALGARLTGILVGYGVPAGGADPPGFGGVGPPAPHFSGVGGGVVPKHLPLRRPRGGARAGAPP